MNPVLLDSSVLLNLLATDRLAAIAEGANWQFAICPAVRDEVKKLRDAAAGKMVDADITPLIAGGVLQPLELAGEDEQTLFLEQAIFVDDGEAMSIALAASRELDLAMDDRQAASHARRRFPKLKLRTTPEILKRWADTAGITAAELRRAINAIEIRARYFPPTAHSLAAWWAAAKRSGPSRAGEAH